MRVGLHIGDGNAYGLVEQSGGTMNMNNTSANIGNHHGTGVYRLTGSAAYNGGTGTVNVGANDGTGTLEFGVGSGSFTAKNLNLAGANSTLKFVLGADGSVIKPNVTDTLTVGTGAKLVVDATGYTGKSRDLMTFAKRDGSFAAGDITVIGLKDGSVAQEGGRLRLRVPAGLVLVVY